MTDPVTQKAKRLHDALLAGHPSADELKDAALMIRKLDTEVTRQKLATGHFLYGQIDRHELRRISESWNSDGACVSNNGGENGCGI